MSTGPANPTVVEEAKKKVVLEGLQAKWQLFQNECKALGYQAIPKVVIKGDRQNLMNNTEKEVSQLVANSYLTAQLDIVKLPDTSVPGEKKEEPAKEAPKQEASTPEAPPEAAAEKGQEAVTPGDKPVEPIDPNTNA